MMKTKTTKEKLKMLDKLHKKVSASHRKSKDAAFMMKLIHLEVDVMASKKECDQNEN